MLMDDTVILATSRERAVEKIQILRSFCLSSGMVINNEKTKFMVINGSEVDLGTKPRFGEVVGSRNKWLV